MYGINLKCFGNTYKSNGIFFLTCVQRHWQKGSLGDRRSPPTLSNIRHRCRPVVDNTTAEEHWCTLSGWSLLLTAGDREYWHKTIKWTDDFKGAFKREPVTFYILLIFPVYGSTLNKPISVFGHQEKYDEGGAKWTQPEFGRRIWARIWRCMVLFQQL